MGIFVEAMDAAEHRKINDKAAVRLNGRFKKTFKTFIKKFLIPACNPFEKSSIFRMGDAVNLKLVEDSP